MTVKAVILDIDGTLIDSCGMIFDRHFEAARKMKLPEVHFKDYASKPGSWEEAIESMWPGVDIEEFKRVFRSLPYAKCKAIPGAMKTVERLKEKYVVGIVTGNETRNAVSYLEECGFNTSVFDFIHGEDTNGVVKPNKGVFDSALRLLESKGIQKDSAVYVGDSVMDEMACNSAGIRFIGVLTGFSKREDFNGAEVIASVAELPEELS